MGNHQNNYNINNYVPVGQGANMMNGAPGGNLPCAGSGMQQYQGNNNMGAQYGKDDRD